MHEIIHVVDPAPLAASLRPTRPTLEIETVDERPLAAGYYFVIGPCKTRRPRDRGKRYFGPFTTRTEARLMQTSAMALGLVDTEQIVQKITECRSIARRPQSTHPSLLLRQSPPRQMETIARAA